MDTGMSTCDTCTHPGACCSGFTIGGKHFNIDNWKIEAENFMELYGLYYFKPVRPLVEQLSSYPPEGKTLVQFDCERLGADGRCTDYENRPETCRVYEAKSDPLCAMYEHQLKGIPIRVQR